MDPRCIDVGDRVMECKYGRGGVRMAAPAREKTNADKVVLMDVRGSRGALLSTGLSTRFGQEPTGVPESSVRMMNKNSDDCDDTHYTAVRASISLHNYKLGAYNYLKEGHKLLIATKQPPHSD